MRLLLQIYSQHWHSILKKSTITANQSTTWIDVCDWNLLLHICQFQILGNEDILKDEEVFFDNLSMDFFVFPFRFAKSLFLLDTCHRSFNYFNFRYRWMWKSWFQPMWPQCIEYQCRRLLHHLVREFTWEMVNGRRCCLKTYSRILMFYSFLSHLTFLIFEWDWTFKRLIIDDWFWDDLLQILMSAQGLKQTNAIQARRAQTRKAPIPVAVLKGTVGMVETVQVNWKRKHNTVFHSRLLDMRLVIANSALCASLAIYHLISNARLWNIIVNYTQDIKPRKRLVWVILFRRRHWWMCKLWDKRLSHRCLVHQCWRILCLPMFERISGRWPALWRYQLVNCHFLFFTTDKHNYSKT